MASSSACRIAGSTIYADDSCFILFTDAVAAYYWFRLRYILYRACLGTPVSVLYVPIIALFIVFH